MRTAARRSIRCAIYTRVSTESGLDQDFNSLDAQYDAAQAYIRSQAHAGWTLVRTRYDDGGFTLGASRLTQEFGRRRAKLKPGTILMREWKAQAYRVMVVDEGFALNGKTYDSLSKLAFAITGTNWNGPRFFGLRDKVSAEATS
jgi:hypothetical protein